MSLVSSKPEPAALPVPDIDLLHDGVLSGDRRALARAITLIESSRADHRDAAETLLEKLMPQTGGAKRIGITGVPGVGKSTFIEGFGNFITAKDHKLAVLAVDPSSKRSGGSILGDKTRMETLSRNPNAFIRPSPAGRTLGGVARRTREAILLCEAAGFDIILVETVGVGQSETAVADMTDMFLLMLLPSGGDDLQGIKKGIVEMADMILVNKADGDRVAAANRAAGDYASALRLIRPANSFWRPSVKTCSAQEGEGFDTVWEEIAAYFTVMAQEGALRQRRQNQSVNWLWGEIGENLLSRFEERLNASPDAAHILSGVSDGTLPPTIAARRLIKRFMD